MSEQTDAQQRPRTVTFFVATDGNDAWSGTSPMPNGDRTDGPFGTIARARDAIREIKASGPLPAPVTVIIREGTHFLEDTLLFGPQDSGTEDCPVAYQAYPGEAPVISGGRPIAGSWQRYQGEILFCTIPEAEQGRWYFRQLSVGGKRQTRARLPNEGYHEIEEAVSETSFQYKDQDIQR